MTNIKVEKGIPIPKHTEKHGKWRATLALMEAGDSFVIELKDLHTLRNTIKHYVKTHAKKAKFTVRKISSENCRCWRIK